MACQIKECLSVWILLNWTFCTSANVITAFNVENVVNGTWKNIHYYELSEYKQITQNKIYSVVSFKTKSTYPIKGRLVFNFIIFLVSK